MVGAQREITERAIELLRPPSPGPREGGRPSFILDAGCGSGPSGQQLHRYHHHHCKGLYLRDLPFVGGQEGGGTVAAVSEEAAEQGIKVGDRVAYSAFGSYAQYTAVPAAKLLPVPDGVGLDVATSCVVPGLTAHYLTSPAHADLIKPDEQCLIHGVGGGTCKWAAQMAKLRGFKVIGTFSKGKSDIGNSPGCNDLIVPDEVPGTSCGDYESVDIVSRVMDVTEGKGCKALTDGIGKSTVDISIGSLAHHGIFISFGNASGAVPAFPVLRLIGKSAYVARPKLLYQTTTHNELVSRADEIFSWLEEGKLNVIVDTAFPLDQAAEGHLYFEAGKRKGKVLYQIDQIDVYGNAQASPELLASSQRHLRRYLHQLRQSPNQMKFRPPCTIPTQAKRKITCPAHATQFSYPENLQ